MYWYSHNLTISQRSTTVPMFLVPFPTIPCHDVPFPTIPCHDATIITWMVRHILPTAQVQHATNELLYSASSCGMWRSLHGRFHHPGLFDERT